MCLQNDCGEKQNDAAGRMKRSLEYLVDPVPDVALLRRKRAAAETSNMVNLASRLDVYDPNENAASTSWR